MSDSQGLQICHYLNVYVDDGDYHGVIVVMTAAVAMTTVRVVLMVMVVVVMMMMMMMMIGARTCFIAKLTVNVPGDPLQFQYTS
jgi:propanediol dehydratase large subunit